MKTSVLFLALVLLATGAVFAQAPGAPPQTLEQLRLSIFEPGPPAAPGDGPLGALLPEVREVSHCTGEFCSRERCECAHQCEPCGIARFNCVAFLCACRQC